MQELTNGTAPIMRAMAVIKIREDLLNQILGLSEQYTHADNKDVYMQQITTELLRLRQTSIKVVELIVLWRDQLRYLALMGTSQKLLRKRRA